MTQSRHSVTSLGVIVTKGHNSGEHSMISPSAVASKGQNGDLPISPTLLAELERSHIKKFYTNVCFIQHRERVVLTSQGTMVLLVGIISQ
jgi:hypothetical protein